jgi:hypothetical protein
MLPSWRDHTSLREEERELSCVHACVLWSRCGHGQGLMKQTVFSFIWARQSQQQQGASNTKAATAPPSSDCTVTGQSFHVTSSLLCSSLFLYDSSHPFICGS